MELLKNPAEVSGGQKAECLKGMRRNWQENRELTVLLLKKFTPYNTPPLQNLVKICYQTRMGKKKRQTSPYISSNIQEYYQEMFCICWIHSNININEAFPAWVQKTKAVSFSVLLICFLFISSWFRLLCLQVPMSQLLISKGTEIQMFCKPGMFCLCHCWQSGTRECSSARVSPPALQSQPTHF